MKRLFVVLAGIVASCSDAMTASSDGGVVATEDASVAGDAAIIDAGEEGKLACTPDIDPATACGGDLTGTWRFIDLCGLPKDLTNFLMTCPAARITENSHTVTGSVAWYATQNYAWTLRDDLAIALEVPVDCTTSSGGCEAFGLLVTIAAMQQVTCMQEGQLCNCFSIAMREDVQDGIWDAVDGTVTTTRSDDGKRRQYYYCVDGDRALLRRTDEGIVLLMAR